MSEEKKKGLKEYQKNYCEAKMYQYNNEYNNFLIVILILIVIQKKIVFLIMI